MVETTSATNPDTDGERTLDEAALLARVMRYFDGAIRGLRKRDRLAILRATDDFWTVMETLSLAPIAESTEYKVRLRGALAKRKLLQMDGGVLSPSSAAALLGVSRQAVGQPPRGRQAGSASRGRAGISTRRGSSWTGAC